MKAAVLVNTGEDLQILQGVAMPEPGLGQVQVKVLFAGVCHSQLAEVRGWRGEDKYLPHMLGHEGVGIVERIGEGVTKVQEGDKVVLGWVKGEGHNVGGAIYNWQGQAINSGAVTTFSEHTIVSENRVVQLPDGMPEELAVLLGCALPTGTGMVFNEAKLPENQKVAVFGLGGIGLSALIAANSRAPSMLIAVDCNPDKLALAKTLGATHVIDTNNGDVLAQVREIAPDGVDFSFEAGGSVVTIEQAFEAIRVNGGRCIFASHPKEGDKIKLDPFSFHCGKHIQGSWGGGSKPDLDIPKLVTLYQEGKLRNIESLLSHEYALEEINTALDDLENRKINRALIKIA